MSGASPKRNAYQSTIALQNERAVVSRLINDIDRLVHEHNFGRETRFGLTRELQAIIRAIVLAQLEGRPFSLSKLADYIGMPRATLERRLRGLVEQGQIVRVGRRYCVPASRLNDRRTLDIVYRLILMIHKASENLPKTPRLGS